jgi:hypothetical protein
MILGDALLKMNSLGEKESLKGRVQMIFMDPPLRWIGSRRPIAL